MFEERLNDDCEIVPRVVYSTTYKLFCFILVGVSQVSQQWCVISILATGTHKPDVENSLDFLTISALSDHENICFIWNPREG